ncbi:YjbQ family protein [Methanosarcinales archaeon]|nr:MAG: YjbQ family protein [Methanosarcinales archaeon]
MSSVVTAEIMLKTQEGVEIHDLTAEINAKLDESGIRQGIVTVFVPGSTGAITTIEYEPGLLQDIPDALERLFPREIEYGHEMMWHDGNGHSHVRAAFLGPDLTVPFKEGRMMLGTWQQVVFIELDNKPRKRRIILQILGE